MSNYVACNNVQVFIELWTSGFISGSWYQKLLMSSRVMYTGSFAIASILRLEILLTEKKNVKITNGCW